MALIKDLNGNLEIIAESVTINRNHFQIVCQLYEFVQFHSAAKQLSENTRIGVSRIHTK